VPLNNTQKNYTFRPKFLKLVAYIAYFMKKSSKGRMNGMLSSGLRQVADGYLLAELEFYLLINTSTTVQSSGFALKLCPSDRCFAALTNALAPCSGCALAKMP
jgi:hypothetical protein